MERLRGPLTAISEIAGIAPKKAVLFGGVKASICCDCCQQGRNRSYGNPFQIVRRTRSRSLNSRFAVFEKRGRILAGTMRGRCLHYSLFARFAKLISSSFSFRSIGFGGQDKSRGQIRSFNVFFGNFDDSYFALSVFLGGLKEMRFGDRFGGRYRLKESFKEASKSLHRIAKGEKSYFVFPISQIFSHRSPQFPHLHNLN